MSIKEINDSEEVQKWCRILLESYQKWKGKPLILNADECKGADLVEVLYKAPQVILAHDEGKDPLFVFANQKAQDLWKYSWREFIGMPSRLSAEKIVASDRQFFLDEVKEKGYSDKYRGIRIAKDGRQFEIKEVVLWNLLDQGKVVGQAACFDQWNYL